MKIVKKSVAATARKFKTLPGKVRQIVEALERDGNDRKQAYSRSIVYVHQIRGCA